MFQFQQWLLVFSEMRSLTIYPWPFLLFPRRGSFFDVFGCRWAPTGYRFAISQRLHCITNTSADDFLDPLLKFSILVVDDFPGIRTELQRLQIVLLISGAHLAWDLRLMEEI
jgi:hypothetical protein